MCVNEPSSPFLQFYLDDLEDELNITALRMLVKDLLILFQACNEGVINVLGMLLSVFLCPDTTYSAEHYFEMSKIDAKEALAIYRHFCTETERVVEYLGVAKKLQNILNVPIPNLRHVCCDFSSRRIWTDSRSRCRHQYPWREPWKNT